MYISSLVVVLLLIYLVSQSSSMMTSVFLVLFCLSLSFVISMDMDSLLFVILFLLVFVGALLVLLLSVVSLSYQDQATPIYLGATLLTFMVTMFYFSSFNVFLLTKEEFTSSHTILMGNLEILLSSLFVLTVGLLVLTSLMLFFKGSVRSV